jgi:flagellar hook-associated protein 2
MIRKINAIDAGVKLSYSEIEDRFILQAEDEGTLNNITLDNDETVDFFSKLSIEDGANRTEATNAIITIDGVEIVKSSNNFTLEGITYNLNSEYSGDDIDISVSQNTDEIYDFIKGFVESYNAIVEDLNTTLSESRDYDYEPLTDDERDAMTEDEIEAWETQAKKGILRSDTTLDNMLTKMRQALYESVEDVGLTLKDMGITTSSEYTDRGKLEIDEYTLKDAISNNYSDVVKLFTSESDIDYTDGDNRSERYEENGLAYRLYDLIQDHVRTTRDTDGNKGILLEKAGKEGDTSYYTNSLTEKIDEYDDRIYEALEYLADKEDYYYEMFANMEAALSEMNSQMASFTSQLGTSS